MFYPSLEQLKQYKDFKVVPLTFEMMSDMLTPIGALRILKEQDEHCFILESVDETKRWSRYTFLGFEPKKEITCFKGVLKDGDKVINVKHPHDYIREVIKEYKTPQIDGLPTFTGGLVGYFAYDYFQYNEPTLNLKKDPQDFNDLDLMLFDEVIAFDSFKQKVILIKNIPVSDLDNSYEKAKERLIELSKLLKTGKKKQFKPLKIVEEFKPDFEKEEFMEMVKKAKHYIKEGDIFQVVLSNTLKAKVEGDLFDTYRLLRTINPSPYMFYFSSNQQEIAGASPETLVKIENRQVYTYPLAGTRPRGKDDNEDKELIKDLLSDEKELAEHHMLVDLGRNDIGKISKIGSVHVTNYLEILKFSHVMHIGSTVEGTIKDDCDALDAINALLPAGTLSGAPKIRACEIIDELEGKRRGIYGGAIGYIDFKGNLDTCIAIRIAYKKDDRCYVRSGAGIVYDSDPAKEYQECLNKAKAVVNALKNSEGGID